MKVFITISLLILFLCVNPTSYSRSQEYKLYTERARITLSGSAGIEESVIHYWQMTAAKMKIKVDFDINNGVLSSVREFSFQLPVKNLKGGNELMNKNAYESLKYKDFPEI